MTDPSAGNPHRAKTPRLQRVISNTQRGRAEPRRGEPRRRRHQAGPQRGTATTVASPSFLTWRHAAGRPPTRQRAQSAANLPAVLTDAAVLPRSGRGQSQQAGWFRAGPAQLSKRSARGARRCGHAARVVTTAVLCSARTCCAQDRDRTALRRAIRGPASVPCLLLRASPTVAAAARPAATQHADARARGMRDPSSEHGSMLAAMHARASREQMRARQAPETRARALTLQQVAPRSNCSAAWEPAARESRQRIIYARAPGRFRLPIPKVPKTSRACKERARGSKRDGPNTRNVAAECHTSRGALKREQPKKRARRLQSETAVRRTRRSSRPYGATPEAPHPRAARWAKAAPERRRV